MIDVAICQETFSPSAIGRGTLPASSQRQHQTCNGRLSACSLQPKTAFNSSCVESRRSYSAASLAQAALDLGSRGGRSTVAAVDDRVFRLWQRGSPISAGSICSAAVMLL